MLQFEDDFQRAESSAQFRLKLIVVIDKNHSFPFSKLMNTRVISQISVKKDDTTYKWNFQKYMKPEQFVTPQEWMPYSIDFAILWNHYKTPSDERETTI